MSEQNDIGQSNNNIDTNLPDEIIEDDEKLIGYFETYEEKDVKITPSESEVEALLWKNARTIHLNLFTAGVEKKEVKEEKEIKFDPWDDINAKRNAIIASGADRKYKELDLPPDEIPTAAEEINEIVQKLQKSGDAKIDSEEDYASLYDSLDTKKYEYMDDYFEEQMFQEGYDSTTMMDFKHMFKTTVDTMRNRIEVLELEVGRLIGANKLKTTEDEPEVMLTLKQQKRLILLLEKHEV